MTDPRSPPFRSSRCCCCWACFASPPGWPRSRACGAPPGGAGGVSHAGRQAGRHRHLRRRLRPVPDRLGGLHRHSALPHHSGKRQVRHPQGLHRPPHRRSEAAGAADRLRVRRVHRRRRGLRHAGGGRGRHAHRPGLLAVLRRRHLPAGEHRAGGLRLDRHPHHDAGRHHRAAGRPAERRRRPHLRAGVAVRAGLPDPGHVRVEGPARGAAGRRWPAASRSPARSSSSRISSARSSPTSCRRMAAMGALLLVMHAATRAPLDARTPAAKSCWPGRPMCLLVVFVLLWGYKPLQAKLDSFNLPIHWPGLPDKPRRTNSPGSPRPGTACLFAAILGAVRGRAEAPASSARSSATPPSNSRWPN